MSEKRISGQFYEAHQPTISFHLENSDTYARDIDLVDKIIDTMKGVSYQDSIVILKYVDAKIKAISIIT